MINEELKKYIEENIFPEYAKNDKAHDLNHIKHVIRRSLEFAESVSDINYDMVYVIAVYHDIGHHIDAKNHEKIGSEILISDDNLLNFFTNEQIYIMADAVYDHRSSIEGEPRSIYGRIIMSADKTFDIDEALKRCYHYRFRHHPDWCLDRIIEDSRNHLINKFGENGYAVHKMYFNDKEYQNYLCEIRRLIYDKYSFISRFIAVNNIN